MNDCDKDSCPRCGAERERGAQSFADILFVCGTWRTGRTWSVGNLCLQRQLDAKDKRIAELEAGLRLFHETFCGPGYREEYQQRHMEAACAEAARRLLQPPEKEK